MMPRRNIPFLARLAAVGLFAGTGIVAIEAQGALEQDPLEIVRQSVARDWTDYASVKNYTYREHFDFRQYTRDGRLSNDRTETHEILILGERPYERLIARDEHPLSESEARKEMEKLDREVAKREHESAARRAQYEKRRAEDREFIREIPDAFTFRLDGVESVSGQPAWVIEAEPKAGYQAVQADAKMFAKIRAKIWIEQATYHWVKVDAQAVDALWFGFGLFRVAPGGTLHFEQTRVNDEIWLPSSILIRGDARMALVKKVRAEFDIRYSGYEKFQSDSHIVENPENGAHPETVPNPLLLSPPQ
jgi:hypothetical protein